MVSLEQWIAAIGCCACYAVYVKAVRRWIIIVNIECVCVSVTTKCFRLKIMLKLDAISVRVQHFSAFIITPVWLHKSVLWVQCYHHMSSIIFLIFSSVLLSIYSTSTNECHCISCYSSIHDHADSHCFMKLLGGSLKETQFHWPVDGDHKKPLTEKGSRLYSTNDVTYINGNLN